MDAGREAVADAEVGGVTGEQKDAYRLLTGAEREVSSLATHSVLGGWKWWRPCWSAGYHAGLETAASVILQARLEAMHPLAEDDARGDDQPDPGTYPTT